MKFCWTVGRENKIKKSAPERLMRKILLRQKACAKGKKEPASSSP
jgi:hypothetical protein